MIERLQARVSPETATYLSHLGAAAFYAVALFALLVLALRRGPLRAIEAAAP